LNVHSPSSLEQKHQGKVEAAREEGQQIGLDKEKRIERVKRNAQLSLDYEEAQCRGQCSARRSFRASRRAKEAMKRQV
jgi:hypothetical protein